jgi:type IV pilus assembly protein PilV
MLRNQKGAILLEGLVAITIFSFGVLALLGMQAVSIKQAAQAKYRNDAGLLTNQIIAQMMVDQGSLAGYADGSAKPLAKWVAEVESTLPNGNAEIEYVDTTDSPRTVTVTVKWRLPSEPTGSEHEYVVSMPIMPAIKS